MIARGMDYDGSEETGRPIENHGAAFEFPPPPHRPNFALMQFRGCPIKNRSNDPEAVILRSVRGCLGNQSKNRI